MIRLDDRVGSADLSTYFRKWQVPFELCRLEYGDAAFDGLGPDGPCPVGIEIKRIHDALNSICDGRFAGHQLPGLIERYQMIWLVIEGDFRADYQTGMLVTHRGKKVVPMSAGSRQFMYRDLDHWLITMEAKANLRVRRTLSPAETARLVVDLYTWWTGKEWHEHRSHLAFDQGHLDGAVTQKPGLVRRIAASLPGVGWVRSQAVARHFRNVVELVLASEEEWLTIDGIGATTAHRVQQALIGVNGDQGGIVAAPKGRV